MKVWELKEILDEFDDDAYVLVISESPIEEYCPVSGHTDCNYDYETNQVHITNDDDDYPIYLDKAIILWPKE